ncbi:CidA/LrgA family holin-like protein [Sporosarcina sp. YIM B06819]|uniref:CidA/LrgA family holin-like protein n=1 Tax=Sporosarcina sp. YIM B06819 TaxID=3081769 RepID=UPI00298CCD7C|nr:CidA/LrgA family holin-like protein [Sporosarcina sp. YIM B06819]
MKYVKISSQVLLLYGFVLAGGWLKSFFLIPLPGSIIGLLLLWAALSLKVFRLQWIESGSYFLLSFIPLFLLPATVGGMDYGHIFTGKGFLLIPITMISTFLTMWISGYTSQFIAQKSAKKEQEVPCE